MSGPPAPGAPARCGSSPPAGMPASPVPATDNSSNTGRAASRRAPARSATIRSARVRRSSAGASPPPTVISVKGPSDTVSRRTAGRSSSTSPPRPITKRPSGRDRSTSVNSSSAAGGTAEAAFSGTSGSPSGVSSTNGLSSSPAGREIRTSEAPSGPAVRRTASGSAAARSTANGSDGRCSAAVPPLWGCGVVRAAPAALHARRSASAISSSPASGDSFSRRADAPRSRTAFSAPDECAPDGSEGSAAAGSVPRNSSPPSGSSSGMRPATLRRTVSTMRPLRSTIALPARLTLLMKLRLMNTPVRIQPPSSRINVPKTPIRACSTAATSMPNAPPQPVEQQMLQLSPKANPKVSDPRIRMRNSERSEWFTSSGR